MAILCDNLAVAKASGRPFYSHVQATAICHRHALLDTLGTAVAGLQ
jgi:hypothetical protein